jgi:hypothetical protein
MIGGGFGLVGAVEGMAIAGAVNYFSREATRAKQERILEAMNQLVYEAHRQIAVMRQVMR